MTEERRLPASLLELVVRRDLVREGVCGTAWFLHCVGGRPSGWEIRGPSFKGFLAGGAKGAFVFSGSDAPSRVAVCEAAIDALSLAAIDGACDDTAYVSTGGGWGDSLKSRLRVQAAVHGRSMEDEARDILRTALSHEPRRRPNLAAAIRARFAPLGGVELPVIPRDAMRAPPTFDE